MEVQVSTEPPLGGHKPPIILKREDLPQPLGPVMSVWSPCRTCRRKSNGNQPDENKRTMGVGTVNSMLSTRVSPLGVLIGTPRSTMLSSGVKQVIGVEC